MLLALVIGTLFGCVSGILVTKGRLQPFIATLITMTAFRGITMIFMNGKPISGLGSSPLLKFVGKGSVLGIPFPVILFVAVFLVFMFVELDAIASVALGGTSMNGGRGRIWGTFVGVLIIAVLNNGLNILGVSSYYQSVVKAVVILIAVLSDRKR